MAAGLIEAAPPKTGTREFRSGARIRFSAVRHSAVCETQPAGLPTLPSPRDTRRAMSAERRHPSPVTGEAQRGGDVEGELEFIHPDSGSQGLTWACFEAERLADARASRRRGLRAVAVRGEENVRRGRTSSSWDVREEEALSRLFLLRSRRFEPPSVFVSRFRRDGPGHQTSPVQTEEVDLEPPGYRSQAVYPENVEIVGFCSPSMSTRRPRGRARLIHPEVEFVTFEEDLRLPHLQGTADYRGCGRPGSKYARRAPGGGSTSSSNASDYVIDDCSGPCNRPIQAVPRFSSPASRSTRSATALSADLGGLDQDRSAWS